MNINKNFPESQLEKVEKENFILKTDYEIRIKKLETIILENKIEKLNERTYGKISNWLPLPIWIDLLKPFKENS